MSSCRYFTPVRRLHIITVKGNLPQHVVILSAVLYFNSCHTTKLFTPFTKLTAASQVHFYGVIEFQNGWGRLLYRISYLNHFLVEDTDAFSLLRTYYALAQRRCLTCLLKIVQLTCSVLASCSFILFPGFSQFTVTQKIPFLVLMYCFA